ncbi:MAG: hypothetical protein H0T99_04335 [Geodermatophilaceae bacterium]|nr:hypothetical protein [Geodermatophilaceae bacterium]
MPFTVAISPLGVFEETAIVISADHGEAMGEQWLFTRTCHPGLYPLDEEMLFDLRVDRRQSSNLARLVAGCARASR